jgi:voltage-gated potassium channel
MENEKRELLTHPFYLLFILIISLLAIISLGIETLFKLDSQTSSVLEYADFAMCIIFFCDFVFNLIQSENKSKYFFTWGWIDLLSSIPVVNVLRWGRVFRIIRIFRVFRAIKTAKIFSSLIIQRKSENVILSILLVFLVLITICSISILKFERIADNSNIKTAGDALWWSIVTITTVGYGDKYPVSSEGRVIATILMIAGVGLFGAFSGLVASWILGPTSEKNTIETLQCEIRELKDIIIKMKDTC